MSQTLTKPILLDETGQAIKTALQNIDETEAQDWLLTYEDVHSEMDDNVDRIADALEAIKDVMVNNEWFLDHIEVIRDTSAYNKQVGDLFESTDINVYGIYYNTIDPTNTMNVDTKMIRLSSDSYTTSIPYGTMLGDKNSIITVTYINPKTGATYTGSVDLDPGVPPFYYLKQFPEKIRKALNAHYAGVVDLGDYWAVGDGTEGSSLYIKGKLTEDDTVESRRFKFVIANKGGKELVNPINGANECAFIVCMYEVICPGESGRNWLSIDYSDIEEIGVPYQHVDELKALGWDNCTARTWCNTTFKNSLYAGNGDVSISDIFKEFKNETATNSASSTSTISNDYFALPAEKEIFGVNVKSNPTAEENLSQFEIFEDSLNRIKTYYNEPSNEHESVSWSTRTITYWEDEAYLSGNPRRDRFSIVSVGMNDGSVTRFGYEEGCYALCLFGVI